MPNRARRSSQADRANREMEWKVDLPVPAFGLGDAFQAMHQWAALKGEYRRDWYQWSFQGGLGPDGMPIPHVCFAFRDGNVAHEFAARWQQHGTTLRHQALGDSSPVAADGTSPLAIPSDDRHYT